MNRTLTKNWKPNAQERAAEIPRDNKPFHGVIMPKGSKPAQEVGGLNPLALAKRRKRVSIV